MTVTQAIAKDNAGEYLPAMNLYQQGLKYLLHTLKYTPNPALKKQLRERCEGYMKRAEQLKKVMAEEDKAGSGGMAAAKKGSAKQKERKKAAPIEPEDREPIDLEKELEKIVGLDEIKQLFLVRALFIHLNARSTLLTSHLLPPCRTRPRAKPAPSATHCTRRRCSSSATS